MSSASEKNDVGVFAPITPQKQKKLLNTTENLKEDW